MAIDISNRPNKNIRQITIHSKRKPGLTADMLKLIAIAAMVIDHIAWAFVPFGSIWGQLMHIIGRLTAPIMCFMVAEGYYKTRNVKKYALRLVIFAVISHIPYVYFHTGKLEILHSTSVMLPLLLGLLALIIRDDTRYSVSARNVMIFILGLISSVGDWGCISVIWIIIFGSFQYSINTKIKYFCISTAVIIALNIIFCAANSVWYNNLFQLGIFLAVPFIMKYNGVKKGGSSGKWFFYIFYPAHLLLIGLLKYVIL